MGLRAARDELGRNSLGVGGSRGKCGGSVNKVGELVSVVKQAEGRHGGAGAEQPGCGKGVGGGVKKHGV